MKILVIGGTQFIGRHVVESLINHGDEVTIFHRGRTNPTIFADVEHRLGDRNRDLASLATGAWDATIDTSAYIPRQVRQLHEALGGRGGRYVHISSVSAYAPPTSTNYNEDSPLAPLEDPSVETVTGQSYGGLKALCELEVKKTFGSASDGVSIVRPTYVAGPFDHTGRFTWWVERIARGGEVLAPGPRENPFQVIDVRDLARFIVILANGKATGIFNAVSPSPPFSFEDFLKVAIDTVGPSDTNLRWVEADLLSAAGLTQAELPLWEGNDGGRWSTADPSRAIEAGLTTRPLAETIKDVHEHEGARAWRPDGIGLDADRELELLRGPS